MKQPLYKINKRKSDYKTPDEPKFNKGGRVGLKLGTKKKDKVKRMMAKKGSPNPKKKKKFPDLTGDGKVTFADILKGRGVINGKKKKKGEIFLTKKKSKNKNV